MKNIQKSRLAILAASVSAVLVISACQPTNEDTSATTKENVTSTSNAATDAHAMDAHAGHDMTGDAMPVMNKEYNDSMMVMHDEMMSSMEYNDPDVAFAQGMLGHHIGAVNMAEIQLKYGTDAEMRQLAQEIIDAQQSEIEQMQSWLANNPDVAAPTTATATMRKAYADSMGAMHGEMMIGIADLNPDKAFARGMLPHHAGAIDMAAVQLKYGKNEEMRKLAQEIIDAQQPEIEQMQNWLAKHEG
ncbi:CopM family metallochaperone [Psychrobacter sp. AOP22-C1-C5]|uniref:CopM family metallochaperone n=1 Tax=Psychrobacter sp. AOP22-C1-C5 TaxID=3457716 RepID=UPI00403676B4